MTYISHATQNQLIGYDAIRNNNIGDIKEAQFFSALADEVSSHNVEHLCLCFRFVDGQYNVREEFIPFITLERICAVDISEAIIVWKSLDFQ